MPKPAAIRLARLFLLALCLVYAPELFAGTATTLPNFTAPLQKVVDWTTGEIGRLASIVVLAGFGMYLWKKRAEDKGERGFFYLIGTATVLGAVNIVDGLGFVGATF